MTIKKRTLIVYILILISVFLITINQFYLTLYDLSIIDYIRLSVPVTVEERNYLNNKEQLTFASDSNAPPFAFFEDETGQYSGLVLDYVSTLSIQLGANIKFIPMTWNNAVNSVVQRKADMCDMFPSKDRKRTMIFSDAIYEIRAIGLVNKDFKINKILWAGQDLVIGIPSGDYAIEYISKNYPDARIVETLNISNGINLLLRGEVNMVIGDEPVILNQLSNMKINHLVSILSEEIYKQDVCISIHPEEKILMNLINKGILQLKKSHYIEKIQQKWFGLSASISKNKIPSNILMVVLVFIQILILAIIGFLIWTSTLGNKIILKTTELSRSRNDLINILDTLDDAIAVVLDNHEIFNSNYAFKDLFFKDDNSYVDLILKPNKGSGEFTTKGRYYIYSVIPIEHDGGAKLISIKDITDIKSSQVQLIQHNKMIAIGQLAAGVAHEIRNPLGIIRNYNYLLESKLMGKDVLIDKAINNINNAVERGRSIVDELLNYTKSSYGKEYTVNLCEQIKSVLTLEEKNLEVKNIIVKFHCNKDIELNINRYSLHHIFINLIDNSIDAMPDGGNISIVCTRKMNGIEILFSDTGEGMSKEFLEYIFNPFFTTKEVGKGVGLGMYIVYNEVKKNSGDIHVESEVGRGTEFYIEFPIKGEMTSAKF